MKRAIATLLAVALVGSLMFMGTAAAQENEIDQDVESTIEQVQTQSNSNSQVGSVSGGSGNLVQSQDLAQVNYGEQSAVNIQDDIEQEVEDTLQLGFDD